MMPRVYITISQETDDLSECYFSHLVKLIYVICRSAQGCIKLHIYPLPLEIGRRNLKGRKFKRSRKREGKREKKGPLGRSRDGRSEGIEWVDFGEALAHYPD
jgi:hypothetical protein